MKFKILLLTTLFSSSLFAADYKVDIPGMHAAIQFKISHLGTSWMWGRFDKFDGEYTYDAEKPEDSKVSITVDTSSVNTNHADRDKHLRSDDFLDVEKYPEATFKSDSFSMNGDKGSLIGQLTLHGVTKEITVMITKVGEGKDPWGGYRTGFEGTTTITMADFGISKFAGGPSGSLELIIALEGKKQK
jgi:polyisoprenoid-binding protein YceI